MHHGNNVLTTTTSANGGNSGSQPMMQERARLPSYVGLPPLASLPQKFQRDSSMSGPSATGSAYYEGSPRNTLLVNARAMDASANGRMASPLLPSPAFPVRVRERDRRRASGISVEIVGGSGVGGYSENPFEDSRNVLNLDATAIADPFANPPGAVPFSYSKQQQQPSSSAQVSNVRRETNTSLPSAYAVLGPTSPALSWDPIPIPFEAEARAVPSTYSGSVYARDNHLSISRQSSRASTWSSYSGGAAGVGGGQSGKSSPAGDRVMPVWDEVAVRRGVSPSRANGESAYGGIGAGEGQGQRRISRMTSGGSGDYEVWRGSDVSSARAL